MVFQRWDDLSAKPQPKTKILPWDGDNCMDASPGECEEKPIKIQQSRKRDAKGDVDQKNPSKKKRGNEDVDEAAKRREWLRGKAKEAVIPEEKAAQLKPEYLFKETGPLVIYLCHACRIYNSKRPMNQLGDGMAELPLGMCTVCRHFLIQQHTMKFYHHDLPSLKKKELL
ncbi:hypothetical protein GCK72_015322 [Caenorhabditis remanei]|uniref:Uncharacterized protein n=1 Tax=Caenorhabditis remanei TaxID=31234 RepID=A0A6A5GWY6_CAERE|nr:hypothetical protein GCK72_015322 [Caenorhabditis remanei]KAF1758862.1 hypothetical protein GCK72_015322 [Caenorhabditis remanei]